MARRSGTRMARQWCSAVVGPTTLAGGTTVLTDLGVPIRSTLGRELVGVTISAIRGRWQGLNIAGTLNQMSSIYAGIIVVTQHALAVGPTAVPHLVTDADADWMWWDANSLPRVPVWNGTNTSEAGWASMPIDNRSMRIVDSPAKTLCLAVLNLSGQDMLWSFAARVLVLRR